MSGPSNLKTDFKTSDSNAISWVKLEDEDIRSCEEFQQSAGWVWILPNGDHYSSYFTSMSICEVRGGVVQGGTCVAILSIPEDTSGNWQVEFYYKGEKQFTDYFTIYSSILQSKIDAANPGDTILIEDGFYNDDYIRVNKRLTIRSENGPSNCIVQAINPKAPVFEVSADYVNMLGFTVKGADNGTRLFHSDYCNISNNNFLYNDVGIYLSESNSSSISNNTCSNNNGEGICLSYSSNNTISGNNVSNNNHSIALYSSSNNEIYLNNFIKNNNNISSYNSTNIWNSTEKITYNYNERTYTNYLGNYWDDYKEKYPDAEEIYSTGIWDTPYSIDGDRDNYPLVKRFESYIISTPIPTIMTI
jgi:parallel beta-helix repeat protein